MSNPPVGPITRAEISARSALTTHACEHCAHKHNGKHGACYFGLVGAAHVCPCPYPFGVTAHEHCAGADCKAAP